MKICYICQLSLGFNGCKMVLNSDKQEMLNLILSRKFVLIPEFKCKYFRENFQNKVGG